MGTETAKTTLKETVKRKEKTVFHQKLSFRKKTLLNGAKIKKEMITLHTYR